MQSLAEFVTKTVKIEDEEITIKKLSTQDQLELEKTTDVIERGVVAILKTVIRWSFKNIDGQPLPVTRESIMKLRSDIITILGLEILRDNTPKLIKQE